MDCRFGVVRRTWELGRDVGQTWIPVTTGAGFAACPRPSGLLGREWPQQSGDVCRAPCPEQSPAVKRRGAGPVAYHVSVAVAPAPAAGRPPVLRVAPRASVRYLGRPPRGEQKHGPGGQPCPTPQRHPLAPAPLGFGVGGCLRGRVGQCCSVELSAAEDEEIVLCPFLLPAWFGRMMLASETGGPRFKSWPHRLLIPGLIIVFRS